MSNDMRPGWFAVKRGITNHPIFYKRPDRAFVWLWMLETAAYQDTRQDAGGKPVAVKRGQVLTSFRQIEDATGVGVQVIRTLIKLLEDERAVNTDTSNGRMLITICNYEKYQAPPRVDNSPDNTEPTQSQHTKETSKQIPPSEGAYAPVDPDKVMFDAGRQILTAAGKSKTEAGRLIGKWRNDHGTEAVIAAIARAQREGAIDPVSFITGCLKFSGQQKAKPQNGEIREIGGQRKIFDQHMGWTPLYA